MATTPRPSIKTTAPGFEQVILDGEVIGTLIADGAKFVPQTPAKRAADGTRVRSVVFPARSRAAAIRQLVELARMS